MVMGVWIWGGTLILLAVELIAGRSRGLFRGRELVLNLTSVVLNAGVARTTNTFLIAHALKWAAPGPAGLFKAAPLWLAFPLVFVVVEFCFYWVHRWAHLGQSKAGLNWLWRLHHTHHSAPCMSVLLTVRQNIFWQFFVPTSWILAFAVYWGQEAAATLTIMTIYGWNLLTHWDFRWDDRVRASRRAGPAFRRLEHLLVSPGMHHTHHGYGRDGAMYRNYAVTLAALDWMFGTLHIPRGRPSCYGVPGRPLGVAEDVLYPLSKLRRAHAGSGAVEPAE